MTIKEAKAYCRSVGCTFVSKPETGEFVVNLIGGTEATAYYTTCIGDAADSAFAMASQKDMEERS